MDIAVVDDIYTDGEYIKKLIYECAEETETDMTVSVFSSAEEFRENINKNFSALFTDILMPDVTGMDMAKMIRGENNEIPIIFVSSDKEIALEGYDVQAFDYLIKPVNKERLKKIIKRLIKKEIGNIITVKQNRYTLNIPVNTIIYAETGNHRTEIHTTKGTISVNISLNDLYKLLAPYNGFAVCRRGTLVNFDMVKSLGDSYILMKNDVKIYLSRGKKTEIKKTVCRLYIFKNKG